MVTQDELRRARIMVVGGPAVADLLRRDGYTCVEHGDDLVEGFDLLLVDHDTFLNRIAGVERDTAFPAVVVVGGNPGAELLTQVRNTLELRLLHARVLRDREELAARCDRILDEQRLTESLVLNVLSGQVVGRLRPRSAEAAGHHPEASVLVADACGFVEAGRDAAFVERMVRELFTAFDSVARSYRMEPMWTLGDPYSAAAGVRTDADDHAARTVAFGRTLVGITAARARELGVPVRLRVGVSSGEVAAVVGARRRLYDMWGDTVSEATRLEAQGDPGCVVVSEATRRLLAPGVGLHRRMDARGRPLHPPSWVVGYPPPPSTRYAAPAPEAAALDPGAPTSRSA